MDRQAETVPTPLFIQGGAQQIVNISGSVVHDHAHHCNLKAAPGEAWMFCVRLCYVVLCCVVLGYVVLGYIMLCYVMAYALQ